MEMTLSQLTTGVGDGSGSGSGDLRSCGPHGEQGEWELMHINASRTETLASRLRPLGAWIPGKNDDGER